MLGFRKRCPGWAGNPQTLARIAPLGFALITAAAVHALPSAFLEAHNRSVTLRQCHGKRQVGVLRAVRTMLRRQTEIPMKGVLRVKVDAPMLEEGIELLLRRPILRIELVDVVVLYIEWLDVLLGTDNPCFPFRYGMVQQPVAYEVHKPVRRDACMVLREKMRMLLDKGNDVI